jgi:hypothetical protein
MRDIVSGHITPNSLFLTYEENAEPVSLTSSFILSGNLQNEK